MRILGFLVAFVAFVAFLSCRRFIVNICVAHWPRMIGFCSGDKERGVPLISINIAHDVIAEIRGGFSLTLLRVQAGSGLTVILPARTNFSAMRSLYILAGFHRF